MEKITRGTIFRNMYQPDYGSYLIFLGYEDRYANCIWVVDTKKNIEIKYDAHFYKKSIARDREHYPIVGHIDIDSLLIARTLNEVMGYAKRNGRKTTENL